MRTIKFIIIISLAAFSFMIKGQSLILGYANPNETVILNNQTAIYDTILLLKNSSLTITNSNITVNSRLATLGSSTLNIENSIFIVNGISVFIKNSIINIMDTVTFNGHIYLQNNAHLSIDSAYFFMDMDYYYQYYLFAEDSSELKITNSTIAFDKGKLGGTFSNKSHSILNNLNFISPVTFIYEDESDAELDSCISPIEFIFHDSCAVNISNSKGFVLWFGIDSGATANFSFPPHTCLSGATNINSYTFSSDSVPGINGVHYTINITNTDTVFFCTMQEETSNVTINNPFIFGCGYNFSSQQHHVSGIYNDSLYTSLSAEFDGTYINLSNSKVFTWNFYPLNNSELFIDNSVFGEMVSYDSSTTIMNNSICDGHGSKLGVYNHSKFFAYKSKFVRGLYLYTHPIMICKNFSFSALYDCQITGDFIINDHAKIYLANTSHNKTPTLNGAPYVLDVFLDTITNAYTNTNILLKGTITDFKTDLSTDSITGYEIGYSSIDSSNYNSLVIMSLSQPIINDTLLLWNTNSYLAGDYLLWLTAYVNGDSAISANRYVYLNDITDIVSFNNNTDYIIYPNPFHNSAFVEFKNFNGVSYKLEMYDVFGNLIEQYNIKTDKFKINRNNIKAGIYFYKIIRSENIIGIGKLIIE